MQKIKLVIKTETKEGAQSILSELGIKQVKNAALIPSGNLYIANIETDMLLTDADYEKIEKHELVSFLRDSCSKKRGEEILDQIYEVEMRLREMLMYAFEAVPSLDLLLRENVKRFKYKENDPITSHLDIIVGQVELGTLLKIFEHDLFNDCGQNVSIDMLKRVLDDSKDFADFKKKATERLDQRYLWDVVGGVVLKRPVQWDGVRNDLYKLDGWRNAAAHFRAIAPGVKEEACDLAKEMLSKIELKDKLKMSDTNALKKRLNYFIMSNDCALEFCKIQERAVDAQKMVELARNSEKISKVLANLNNQFLANVTYLNKIGYIAQESLNDAIRNSQNYLCNKDEEGDECSNDGNAYDELKD